MFLRKALKSFGLLTLILCISISTQNETITVKAASNGSEIRLDDQDIDTLQPSQIYVIKLNPDGDLRKIDELNVSLRDDSGVDEHFKAINVLNRTNYGLFTEDVEVDYHYAVSIWLNGVNVTKKCTNRYNYITYNIINDWAIFSAGCDRSFSFNEGTVFEDLEVKIQKIKCDKAVTTQESTCTTFGYIKTTCQVCKNVYLEMIKPSHTYVTKQTKYPTVYNAGTIDSYCTKCGDESISEIPQYEFNVSVGGSQLKAIKLGHKLLFANTHKDAKYIPFVVPNGKSVFDIK